MKHHDPNPDEAIDRVLTGLREAEPLQGMRERVLRGARERAGARRRWSFQLPRATTHSWAIPAAAIAIIAISASWALLRGHGAVRETAHAPAHILSPNAPTAETHLTPAHFTPTQPAHEPKSVIAEKSALPIEPVNAEEALAISEMNAPSKPAPPLLLTHEERLLAEVVHHGAPEELASLRLDVRAREIEIAKAEFREFFEPPSLDPPPAKANE